MKKMIFSKSNYILYLKHPAWLWLEKHDKSKLPEVDEDTQALFDAGNLFEDYAEELFPDATRLGFSSFPEYKALPLKTKEALSDGAETIYQGRFEADGLTCIVDVLKRVEGNVFDLYEIKGSTKVKKDHYYDLAFQKNVIEKCGLEIRNLYVTHVNNQYVRDGEVDAVELCTTDDVTEEINSLTEETKYNIEKMKKDILTDTMPDPAPYRAGLGTFSEWLRIYKDLESIDDPYSVYNLYSPGAKRLRELVETLEVSSIKDIPDDFKLTVKQQGQVQATKSGERIIDQENIKEFLGTLKYPLYFLDYETLASVIPMYDGIRPYQQIPFQYSLHILESPDAKLTQKEYLHTENTHPVKFLVKKLKEDIGPEGSIVVWNQSFEKSCNTAMSEFVPEHAEFLRYVNERIVDLMIPFMEGWFVDKDFFGSASIKAVLPVLIPELSYKELNIQGGNAAQRIWMQTITGDKNQEEKDKVMADLRKYCGLDTLAMVEIYRKFREVIED